MRTSAYACVAAVAATIVAPVSASAMNEQVSTEASRFTIQKLADGALEESTVTAEAVQKALVASSSERRAEQVREAHSAGVNEQELLAEQQAALSGTERGATTVTEDDVRKLVPEASPEYLQSFGVCTERKENPKSAFVWRDSMPRGVMAAASEGRLEISWQAKPWAGRVEISRDDRVVAVVAESDRSFVDTAVEPGENYQYSTHFVPKGDQAPDSELTQFMYSITMPKSYSEAALVEEAKVDAQWIEYGVRSGKQARMTNMAFIRNKEVVNLVKGACDYWGHEYKYQGDNRGFSGGARRCPPGAEPCLF